MKTLARELSAKGGFRKKQAAASNRQDCMHSEFSLGHGTDSLWSGGMAEVFQVVLQVALVLGAVGRGLQVSRFTGRKTEAQGSMQESLSRYYLLPAGVCVSWDSSDAGLVAPTG